ncbi:MAG TPA: EamA family transporter [Steroidobacteraceae bacterium]|nr:EamA family transporter [Steroidobacteraceae bacterium]
MVHNSSKSLANYAAFAFVAIIWGTTWVAIKISLQGYPPFAGAMFRFLFAIAMLILYARMTRISLALPRDTMRWIIVTAILLYVIDYGLIYWGEQYLNAGVTAILFAALPLATTLMSAFVFKSEPFRYRQLVGICFGLGGIVVVFFDQLVITDFNANVILAAIAIVVAAIAAALNVVIAKRHLMIVDALPLAVHQMIWGSLGLGIIAALTGEFRNVHYSVDATTALLYLGLAGSAVAFVMYYSLLKTMSASALSTITYFTPLVAVFSGWLLLKESISMRVGVGAFAIFIGIAIIQFDDLIVIARRSLRLPLSKVPVQTESPA